MINILRLAVSRLDPATLGGLLSLLDLGHLS